MNVNNLISQASNAIKLVEITPLFWQIKAPASFLNGKEITVYLKQENGNWFLTDEKETLKYMHEFYELKSKDVKTCIANILKIYGFAISGGKLIATLNDENAFLDKYFDYIMCVAQLTNMFAFFDKPE